MQDWYSGNYKNNAENKRGFKCRERHPTVMVPKLIFRLNAVPAAFPATCCEQTLTKNSNGNIRSPEWSKQYWRRMKINTGELIRTVFLLVPLSSHLHLLDSHTHMHFHSQVFKNQLKDTKHLFLKYFSVNFLKIRTSPSITIIIYIRRL